MTRDEEIIALYLADEPLSQEEIGARFFISRQRVGQIVASAGVARERNIVRRKVSLGLDARTHTSDEQVREAHRLCADGATWTEQALRLGVKPTTLANRSKRLGLAPIKRLAPHGRRSRYVRGCRCELCREANRLYFEDLKTRTPPIHGTYSTYSNYGCRCSPCRTAGSKANRDARERREREVVAHAA